MDITATELYKKETGFEAPDTFFMRMLPLAARAWQEGSESLERYIKWLEARVERDEETLTTLHDIPTEANMPILEAAMESKTSK